MTKGYEMEILTNTVSLILPEIKIEIPKEVEERCLTSVCLVMCEEEKW